MTTDAAIDPRVARSKAAILDACAELLAEEGFGGVSIEAVSARSGAAKTTIYRHWPNRETLLVEAFCACAEGTEPLDTGAFRSDLLGILGGLAGALAGAQWCAALPSLVDAAARDPEIAQVYRAFQATKRRPLELALERARKRGELPPDTDIPVAVALCVGPLFYRRMISAEPLGEPFVEQIVDRVLRALGAVPAP